MKTRKGGAHEKKIYMQNTRKTAAENRYKKTKENSKRRDDEKILFVSISKPFFIFAQNIFIFPPCAPIGFLRSSFVYKNIIKITQQNSCWTLWLWVESSFLRRNVQQSTTTRRHKWEEPSKSIGKKLWNMRAIQFNQPNEFSLRKSFSFFSHPSPFNSNNFLPTV